MAKHRHVARLAVVISTPSVDGQWWHDDRSFRPWLDSLTGVRQPRHTRTRRDGLIARRAWILSRPSPRRDSFMEPEPVFHSQREINPPSYRSSKPGPDSETNQETSRSPDPTQASFEKPSRRPPRWRTRASVSGRVLCRAYPEESHSIMTISHSPLEDASCSGTLAAASCHSTRRR